MEAICNQCGADTSYTVYAQMYTAYAWKPVQDTPLMRKRVHRLCVEISQDSRRNVDISGELLQLFRLGF